MCLIFLQSINVSDAFYESKWYEMPIKDQKRILYGIHRSQKPLVLTGATSKCYSLEIFAKVRKTFNINENENNCMCILKFKFLGYEICIGLFIISAKIHLKTYNYKSSRSLK